jgi:hypothetical protein
MLQVSDDRAEERVSSTEEKREAVSLVGRLAEHTPKCPVTLVVCKSALPR